MTTSRTALIVSIIAAGAIAGVLLAVGPEASRKRVSREPAVGPVATATLQQSALQGTPTAPFTSGLMFGGRGPVFAVLTQTDRWEDEVLVVTLGLPSQTVGHGIVWRQDGSARIQLLEARSATERDLLTINSSVIGAVAQFRQGVRELGILYDTSSYGSGSPQLGFALLRVERDEWRVVWQAGVQSPDWRGSHGRAEFPQGDLSEFIVYSDSWITQGDPLSGVLQESNSGPHRYFLDRWIRQGDAYVRQSAETVPSAYATLVEFLYALSNGDDARARALATDASLLERARDLGLDDAPGKNWLISCDSPDCGTQNGPIGFDSERYHGEPSAVIVFQHRAGRYLISDIRPSEGP